MLHPSRSLIALSSTLSLVLCACTASLESGRDGGRGVSDGSALDGGVAPNDGDVVGDGGVGVDSYVPPALPPPLALPPAPPPDHSAIIGALAAERPGLLASSCVAMGGTTEFLFEAARRLRGVDVRYGLVARAGALLYDRVGYFYGTGVAEGSSETYVIDIIQRHCGVMGVDAPAAPGWGDDTSAGGLWTIAPLDGGTSMLDGGVPVPADAGGGRLPLPDESGAVATLASERPDLLASSCVADGGNNEFLFELVRRLRRGDARWGLNWKRGVVGDMSQDVIDYYYGPGAPTESAPETYVIDVIGGHCGASPSPTWIDQTGVGGAAALWTLAGRTDLGP